MSEDLYWKQLGPNAWRWVSEELSHASKIGILLSQQIERGEFVLSVLVDRLDVDTANGFDSSAGINTSQIDDAIKYVLHQKISSGRVAIFEHALAEMGDDFLSRWPFEPREIAGKVCIVLEPEEVVSSAVVNNAMMLTQTAGAFCAYIFRRGFSTRNVMEAAALESNVEMVFLAAFDGETYVCCERSI